MNHLLDDEELPRRERERELTLSTGAILGIFLGLAVLCGGFFGFGYNMGRKSAPTPLTLNDLNTDASAGSGAPVTPTAKPAAGSPLDATSAPAPTTPPKPVHHVAPPPTDEDDGTTTTAEVKPTPAHGAAGTTPSVGAAPIVRHPAPISPAALSPTVPAATASTGGSFMVQVAAVSHKEDADLLLGALRARGYSVSTHTGTADSFIHVQVGPFRDKKDADAMRQRLITDGYNAIVKQ